MRRARALAGAALLAGVGALAGCGGDESALDPAGPEARRLLDDLRLMIGLSAVIYVVVVGLLLAALLWRRRHDGDRTPRMLRGRRLVIAGGIVVPAAIAVVLTVLTVSSMQELSRVGSDDALEIAARGDRWFWEFSYPGLGITTANEVTIPVGRAVRFRLESDNVIHSLWIPALGGKRDLIPGTRNELTLRADEPGVFRARCAEYCGVQHAKMGLRVIALAPDEFEEWALERRAAVQARRADETTPAGLGLFVENCARCHTVDGTPANGRVGPDLTHVGTRLTIGAGTVPATPDNLARWIADPEQIKEDVRMPAFAPVLTPAEIRTLVDYLESLE